jgi:hypothetical protein
LLKKPLNVPLPKKQFIIIGKNDQLSKAQAIHSFINEIPNNHTEIESGHWPFHPTVYEELNQVIHSSQSIKVQDAVQ